MKKIVFATNNSHKLTEVRAIVGQQIEILSLADINCFADIPETADTLEGNALLKARYVYDQGRYRQRSSLIRNDRRRSGRGSRCLGRCTRRAYRA